MGLHLGNLEVDTLRLGSATPAAAYSGAIKVWPLAADSFESAGAFESIATVTVGSGGASSIEFTSIPGTYRHLQVRGLIRTSESSAQSNYLIRLNGDTGASYKCHNLRGSGSAVTASNFTDPIIGNVTAAGSAASSGVFGAFVIDILDYASASKTTTVRSFSGTDNNGSGFLALSSVLFTPTSGITQITFVHYGVDNLAEHSTAALYGIKA